MHPVTQAAFEDELAKIAESTASPSAGYIAPKITDAMRPPLRDSPSTPVVGKLSGSPRLSSTSGMAQLPSDINPLERDTPNDIGRMVERSFTSPGRASMSKRVETTPAIPSLSSKMTTRDFLNSLRKPAAAVPPPSTGSKLYR